MKTERLPHAGDHAATFGSVHPCIYVTSGLVNKLPLNLLPSVLAHECGHIACKHSLYHSIAAQLVGGIDRSPLVRIPAIGKYLTPTKQIMRLRSQEAFLPV